jgi:ubiquinol-cytochrome c reductase iron-sulfur subunit
MSMNEVDRSRRRFLLAASTALGGAAAVAVASPFVMSMLPSQRAKAAGAPVEADISKVEPGMMISVGWRGKPVWVVNRTPAMLAQLPKNDPRLRDPHSEEPQQPEYCKNETRSIKPQYLIAIGICTHLGCSPTFRPEVGPADIGPDWPGGFLCPCHGSRFDLAARVFQNVPAPLNLEIPPHQYLSDTRILIGQDKETKGT